MISINWEVVTANMANILVEYFFSKIWKTFFLLKVLLYINSLHQSIDERIKHLPTVIVNVSAWKKPKTE